MFLNDEVSRNLLNETSLNHVISTAHTSVGICVCSAMYLRKQVNTGY